MHEVSLVSALVDQIEELKVKEDFAQVLEIRLGIGTQSGVNPESIEFCFSEVTRKSCLQGAKLVLERLDSPSQITKFCVLDLEVR